MLGAQGRDHCSHQARSDGGVEQDRAGGGGVARQVLVYSEEGANGLC